MNLSIKGDLHTHTISSDGTKTYKEIIDQAVKASLDFVAITDHDITGFFEEAKEYAKSKGITFIPGIELSTLHRNKSVHVLGYFKDDSYNNEAMNTYYKMIKEGRENRTHEFIKKLKQHFDIDITYENVYKFSRGIIARPHIAKAINETYPEYSFDYIFDTFIGDHSKAYVPSTQLPVEDGVKLLRDNNAIAVLAHPTLLKEHIKEEVLKMDFDGIEAIYYRNQGDDETFFKTLAEEKGMIITAGSDYHGIKNDTKHGTVGEIFLPEPYSTIFLKKWMEKQ